MTDWSDAKAKELTNRLWDGFKSSGKHLSDAEYEAAIAQALRDMQRETAEECAAMCRTGHSFWTQAIDLEATIRERFGLDKKPRADQI
jgi:hypothetical protein